MHIDLDEYAPEASNFGKFNNEMVIKRTIKTKYIIFYTKYE